MVWLSLNNIEIPDKVLAKYCESGGWPLSHTVDIISQKEVDGSIVVRFTFTESESACCSSVSCDAEWTRFGEYKVPK